MSNTVVTLNSTSVQILRAVQREAGAGEQVRRNRPRPRPRWTARRIWTDVLLSVTTVLLIVGIVAIWANRQFNPDNWASTSTSLLENWPSAMRPPTTWSTSSTPTSM